MKVKLRTQYAGPLGTYSPGTVVDFDEKVATDLIDGGYAERMELGPPASPFPKGRRTESARVGPAETAALPPAKRRG